MFLIHCVLATSEINVALYLLSLPESTDWPLAWIMLEFMGHDTLYKLQNLKQKKAFLSLIYESNEGNFETNCYWGTPKTDRISPVTFLPDCHVCRRLPGFKNNIVYRQINKMPYFTGNLWLFAIYQTLLTAPVNSALMCFE